MNLTPFLGKDEVTVSLEGFVSRPAVPPGPQREAAKEAP
jgi:hypothetical protein